jgi:hypothetical protein
MPAPVTHIILALSILPLLPGKNFKEFILGVSFPDIRYLGVIERSKTHDAAPSWQKVIDEKSSFKAGIEFHALVDKMHEKYMATHKVYAMLPMVCLGVSKYLKFFEDMLLYNQCTIWPQIASFFDTISDDAHFFITEDSTIELWQNSIMYYISEKPTPESIAQVLDLKMPVWYGFLLRIPVHIHAQYTAAVLNSCMAEFMQNQRIHDCIFDFYYRFPDLIMHQTGVRQHASSMATAV